MRLILTHERIFIVCAELEVQRCFCCRNGEHVCFERLRLKLGPRKMQSEMLAKYLRLLEDDARPQVALDVQLCRVILVHLVECLVEGGRLQTIWNTSFGACSKNVKYLTVAGRDPQNRRCHKIS